MNDKLPTNHTGLRRLVSASVFSWQGFRDTYKTEESFRQECWVGCVLIPLSFFVADTAVEWILLMVSYLLIPYTEILNTSIEAVVDRFGGEIHELSGKAKDAGSSAVFLAIVIAVITWGGILIF